MQLDSERQANLDNWDSRVDIHYGSDVYGVQRFIDDPTHLSGVVAFDRTKLPDLTGKRLIHLQCHIGTDTVSLARLGAEVTGVDFSAKAIESARRLSEDSGTPARFVESELHEAKSAVPETFDVVYTGVGAINWMPDIRAWAQVVSSFLEPGGVFYIREAHPVLWALDEDDPDFLKIEFPYFEGEALPWVEETTYAGDGVVTSPMTYSWNHGIGETLTALIDAGLRIDRVEEYDFCEWQGISQMVEDSSGHWRLPDRPERLPLMWSVLATKV